MTENPNLIQRIAESAESSEDTVLQILNDYGMTLASPSRQHRSLRVDRLRIRGAKAGDVEPGDFDRTFVFPVGVIVISADNLRGKTTILELLTLLIRGEPRDLQSDVLSWLTSASLDMHLNGQSIGLRLRFDDSHIIGARILAGTPDKLALSDDDVAHGVTDLARAQSDEEWAEVVGTFMMSQLGLDAIQVFNKAKNDDEAGTIKSHGWPAYYGAIYPPSGADKVLLGSTASDYLPVRLMQVFLDMPDATRAMRVSALAKRLDSEHKAEQRRHRDARDSIAHQLDFAEQRQAKAEEQLADLQAQTPAESLQDLIELASDASKRVIDARQAAEAATSAYVEAQQSRIADEKALNGLRESAAASALFHGLDPKHCPRCEEPIKSERKQREHEYHQCAVCDAPLATEDDDYAEREQCAVDALVATRAAEGALAAARSASETQLAEAQKDLNRLDERIGHAQAARQATARLEAEHELAAAQAVVQALEQLQPEPVDPPVAQVVLAAADSILREEIKQFSTELYKDLSAATLKFGVAFGISELESVRIKANGTMDVTKGGGATSSFSSQSPGERLRLRYALVVSLLRLARDRGIAGHPGLLLLDSLKAEEVQDDHARILLEGLVTAAAEEPELQIFVTTADRSLAAQVSGVTATIEPDPGKTAIF
ncbi:hypothetical protein DFO66_107140 [Brevibacterium sanguinis]|uniref:AAA domain-containing protein n=2 Tax=Brevibacterium TaxID=1696 RepID=A0A366IKK2_9MICO|nr:MULTISPECIES: hypothetical protein [Brevibacterium]RBP64263.1 hypothetical protein DFO66_107140 [Brevibacterium sanguinis]RBP71445.1 hypothetical protein DFO65_10544 [Brevibacterium celere]